MKRSAITFITTAVTARSFSLPSLTSKRIQFVTVHPTRAASFFNLGRKSTSLPMIFNKIFSSLGSGGGYSAKIDYSSIPFPVPELAAAAQEGKSLIEIDKNGKKLHLATVAMGCFWGGELAYQRVPGVEYTSVGYTQGQETLPTYDQVCSGATGHTEAIIVAYNPKECSYETILDKFFDRVDPTTANGQGNDRGPQYRTGVYFHSKAQEEVAKARFQQEQEKYGRRKIASECLPSMPFWPAEKYHQQYLEKGGRFNSPQSAEKGCIDTIRCYG